MASCGPFETSVSGALIEAVRDRIKTVGLKQVNAVLMKPSNPSFSTTKAKPNYDQCVERRKP